MIIQLNDALRVNKLLESPADSLRHFTNSLKRQLAGDVYTVGTWDERRAQQEQIECVRQISGQFDRLYHGYMDLTSTAYSRHYSLEMAPHDLWYIVMTQLATAIKDNSEACRDLFSSSPDKQLVLVPQDHEVDINLSALIEQMKLLIPADTELFLPQLSTHTIESELACAAAFADGMSNYYDYGMFCCGIPQIKLSGTAEDWSLLYNNLTKIQQLFIPLAVMSKTCLYLDDVLDIVSNIGQTYVRPDMNTEFWLDIFTQRNVGSGGDLVVDGWLTRLYLCNSPGKLIKSYHNTVTKVLYKNVSTGQQYAMMHGAFRGVIQPNDTLQAQYDHVTFELKSPLPRG